MTQQNEGPYDGQNWPTHSIAVWLLSDGRFVDTARNYAKLDESGTELRSYLFRLLFDRHALASEERRLITRDATHDLDQVSSELDADGAAVTPSAAFGTVNWQYLHTELLAE